MNYCEMILGLSDLMDSLSQFWLCILEEILKESKESCTKYLHRYLQFGVYLPRIDSTLFGQVLFYNLDFIIYNIV